MFGGNPLFVCLGLNPTFVESNVCWLNLRFQRISSYLYSNLGIQTLDLQVLEPIVPKATIELDTL